jgi:RHS repeat-associated protein
MKTKLTFVLVAALTSTAFAAFQAPLPEFKNEKQLAEWRAEKASESTNQGYASEETAFYTGKPYLASSGGYAFKYRSYNPEVARWTSEDPSGFPDGANQNRYAPKPTSEIDSFGLWRILILDEKTDQKTLTTNSGNLSAIASITAVGVNSVPVENTNQFSGFKSISLSGWGGAVNFQPANEFDLTVDSNTTEKRLKATLSISDTGTFLHASSGGSSLENNKLLNLGIGLSIRVDPHNPRYAYAKITASSAINGGGLTGFGVNFGPVGVSASWNSSTGNQRPVETIELKFKIVE